MTLTSERLAVSRNKTEGRLMIGRSLICLLLTVILLTGATAEAQQATKFARIGYLTTGPRSTSSTRVEALRLGLSELGYTEGRNIVIEARYAEGKLDRLTDLAAELVRLKVDVIVTGGATVTRTVRKATFSIPIVMAQDPDPVGNGHIASLARPGGNITGLSSLSADLSGKRVELLKEILPQLSRLAVLGTSTNAGNERQLRETKTALGAFGVQLHYLDVLSRKDIQAGFRAASKGRADAVLILSGPLLNPHRTEIAQLAVKYRLPVIHTGREYVEAGGLIAYGVSTDDLARRAATYVDKILKGAKPADLPVEQPTKFELVINLKAAKQIGLPIPPNVLARADRVLR
jgi:putative tryptophan/tyrosine transport system substrate-binding protein